MTEAACCSVLLRALRSVGKLEWPIMRNAQVFVGSDERDQDGSETGVEEVVSARAVQQGQNVVSTPPTPPKVDCVTVFVLA